MTAALAPPLAPEDDGITVEVGDLTRWRSRRNRIVRIPGVCSGRPHIAGTRTPASTIQAFWDTGAEDDAVLGAYPHLVPADLDAVRAWLAPSQCAAVARLSLAAVEAMDDPDFEVTGG